MDCYLLSFCVDPAVVLLAQVLGCRLPRSAPTDLGGFSEAILKVPRSFKFPFLHAY